MAQVQRKATTRDWPFQVKPLHPSLGCEISGITLAEAVEPKLFDKVYEAFLDYELILFRDVDLPPAGITQKVKSIEGFLVFHVNGKTIKVDAIDINGEVIDTTELK